MQVVEWPETIIYNKQTIQMIICILSHEKTLFFPIELSEIKESLKDYYTNGLGIDWEIIVSIRGSVKVQQDIKMNSLVTSQVIIDLFKKFKLKYTKEIINQNLVESNNDKTKQTKTFLLFNFIRKCKCSFYQIFKVIRSKDIPKNEKIFINEDKFLKSLIFWLEDKIKYENTLSKENSLEFENSIEEYLKLNKIIFKSEYEQRMINLFSNNIEKSIVDLDSSSSTENKEKELATPDFLFPSTIKLSIKGTNNTIDVNWIDAKNYAGLPLKYIISSLKKQGKKYKKYYGSGAFVFRYGFSSDLSLQIDDVYILSFHSLTYV